MDLDVLDNIAEWMFHTFVTSNVHVHIHIISYVCRQAYTDTDCAENWCNAIEEEKEKEEEERQQCKRRKHS